MNEKPDNNCPLCGAPNQCAVAAGAPPEACWCRAVRVSPEILAALPDGERGLRCICPVCAEPEQEE